MTWSECGIDTYYGRILPPTVNRVFSFLDRFLGKTDKVEETVYQRFLQVSEIFVDNLPVDVFDDDEEERNNKFKNKNEAKQYYYYILSHLFKRLISTGFTLDELMNPQNLRQYVVARTYLNPFIEAMEMVHHEEKEYNHHAYKYIINNEEIDDKIKIIENYNDPSYRIVEIEGKDLPQYLKKNNIGVTISGTLFKTNETDLSLFYVFLNELYTLRKQYKKQMYNYPKGSTDFNEFNRRQLTTKVIMNSTYGLLGMSSFRYSNKWLAKTITTSGRLALKTAQFYTEKYIDAVFNNQ